MTLSWPDDERMWQDVGSINEFLISCDDPGDLDRELPDVPKPAKNSGMQLPPRIQIDPTCKKCGRERVVIERGASRITKECQYCKNEKKREWRKAHPGQRYATPRGADKEQVCSTTR